MEILFNNLDKLLDAPNGIEKARQLILQLAVQGKLTEQDPNDEPASELLKKIKKEKEKPCPERSEGSGKKIKKQPARRDGKELPPIKDEEKPFELPKSWEWVRLGNVVSLLGDGLHGTPEYDISGEYYFVNGNNLSDGKIEIKSNTKTISLSQYQKHKRNLDENTVLVSINGTIGNVAFYNNEKIILGKSACYFNLIKGVDKNYIKKIINTQYFLKYAFSAATGTTIKNVSLRAMREFPFSLPPLTEQKRIVEKVNSLMALLNEIEEKRERRNQKRIKLNNSSLDKLLTSKNDKELKTNWKQIEENFSTLYSVPENVVKLKQAILQLAVQGKLVEQDPNDEPAFELLKKIKKEKEKEKLIAEGNIKKQKELPPIKDEEKPFELPMGWEWVRLEDITEIIAGNGFDSQDFSNIQGVKCIKITNVGVKKFVESNDFLPPVFKTKYNNYLVNSGDIVIALTRPYIIDGLKVCRVPASYSDSLLNQRVAAIKNEYKINFDFLFYYLSSDIVLNKYKARFQNTGLQPNLKMKDLTLLEISLPPLNEQKRIVEKVNELMSLCNALEEKLKKKEEKGERLVGAVVNRISNNYNK